MGQGQPAVEPECVRRAHNGHHHPGGCSCADQCLSPPAPAQKAACSTEEQERGYDRGRGVDRVGQVAGKPVEEAHFEQHVPGPDQGEIDAREPRCGSLRVALRAGATPSRHDASDRQRHQEQDSRHQQALGEAGREHGGAELDERRALAAELAPHRGQGPPAEEVVEVGLVVGGCAQVEKIVVDEAFAVVSKQLAYALEVERAGEDVEAVRLLDGQPGFVAAIKAAALTERFQSAQTLGVEGGCRSEDREGDPVPEGDKVLPRLKLEPSLRLRDDVDQPQPVARRGAQPSGQTEDPARGEAREHQLDGLHRVKV